MTSTLLTVRSWSQVNTIQLFLLVTTMNSYGTSGVCSFSYSYELSPVQHFWQVTDNLPIYHKFWYSFMIGEVSLLLFFGVMTEELGKLDTLDTLVEHGDWVLWSNGVYCGGFLEWLKGRS